MAERRIDKWSILLAIQRRLDKGKVTRYEAVLALKALAHLFPTPVADGLKLDVSSTDAWVRTVGLRLENKIEGELDTAELNNENWMAVWMSQSVIKQVIGETNARSLLAWAEEAPEGIP